MRLFSFDILFSPRFHLECACEGAILPRSDWAFLRRGTYGGTEAKAHHFATQFRQPNDCRPRKRYVWGTRQSRWLRTADGFAVCATCLCFLTWTLLLGSRALGYGTSLIRGVAPQMRGRAAYPTLDGGAGVAPSAPSN